MTTRRWLAVALVLLALVLLAGRIFASLYVEYQWFAALDALPLWRARAANTFLLRGISGAAGSLFVFVNLYAVRHSVVSLVLPRRLGNLEIGEEVPSRYLFAGVAVASLLLGAILTVPQESWTTLDLVRHGRPFGERDPYFQLDLGFYVYWLPFEISLYIWSLIALLLVTAVVVFLYALTPSLRLERGRLRTSGYVRRHFSVLGALMLMILAWSYRLDAFALLAHGSGPDGIFSYVDHHVNVQVNLLLALVTLAAAALVLWTGWTGQVRVAFIAVSSVIVLSLLLRQALPAVVQRTRAPADPVAREFPYIATRAGYTRRAFGVDRIRRVDDASHASIEDVARRGAATTWDAATLARLTSATVRGRDEDGAPPRARAAWELDDDGIGAVIVMPQEGGGPAAPRSPWLATRVHAIAADERGGVVSRAGPAPDAAAEASGVLLPPAFIQDSAAGSAAIIVADTGGRLAGPPVVGWLDRLANAWSQQNVRLLVADLPSPSPRVIRRRDVRERVRALAPFFVQGATATPLVAGRELYWTLDLYVASAAYPLSRRFLVLGDEWSYVQHAAIAVVHAYTGRVWLVLDPALDPVAGSWRERFPGMFTASAALPAEIARRLPPAVDGALAQAGALARYGARGESPPMGQLPRSLGADTALATPAPPVIALPPTASRAAALAVSIPVLDSTQHVLGVVLATGGPRRETLWHALSAPGPRWPRILDQLQRPPRTDSGGVVPRDARAVRGAVRAVPVAGGVAYMQPTFAVGAGRAAAPALVRVTILEGDSLYFGASLADAAGLARDPMAGDSAALSPQAFRARVATLYETMRAALARGDWPAFGRAYESLGQLLGRPPR